MTIDEISARLEIQDVLFRYCRGVDRGDLEMIRSVYHPDAIDDHGSTASLGHEFAAKLVERLDEARSIGQRHITNVLIELNGGSAKVESYFISFVPDTNPTTGERTISFVNGRYLDRFEKRAEGWKIAHRKVVLDWSEQGGTATPWARIAQFEVGGRREADPSYAFFHSR